MSHILAFDLGGSSLRLAIVAHDGRFLDHIRKPLRISHDGEHAFEADPLVWWTAFQQGCAELAAMGYDFAAIEAVAGCGFTRTQVFLDASGAPIRPAITFQDSRAAAALDEMQITAPAAISDVIGALSPYDPLARLLWLQCREPDHWERLRKIVEPKDFLNMMLTGIAVSDTISQTPMARTLGPNGTGVLASLGIDPDILPDMKSPFDQLGVVQPGLPFPLSDLAGTPVYCGSLDTWSCVLGSGALVAGAAYSISGTSDVFGVISETRHAAEGLLSVEWGPQLWQLGGPSQGGATRLQWAMDRFYPGASAESALQEAFASNRPAPLFLPYLDGERTPFWDADLGGAFLGLHSSHGNADLLRGVAEGINYLSRDILLRAEEAIGARVDYVSFSGGLAASPALCQLKADVLNRPVLVPDNRETGLMGAARIPRMPGAGEAGTEGYVTYGPAAGRLRYHDDRFAIFRSATDAIRPISHRMRAMGAKD